MRYSDNRGGEDGGAGRPGGIAAGGAAGCRLIIGERAPRRRCFFCNNAFSETPLGFRKAET